MSTNKLIIQPGVTVVYRSKQYKITHYVDFNWVLGEEETTGKIERLKIKEIVPLSTNDDLEKDQRDIPFEAIDEDDYLKAQYRYSIIKTLIQNPGDGELVKQVVEQSGISKTTIYRWLELYNQGQKISSLIPLQKGGKGIGRISPEIEEVIKCAIEDVFLSRQKKSIQKVCIEVINKCRRAGIEPPHVNTIRNRISQISEYEKAKGRLGKREAKLKYGPKIGTFPGADYPLSIVQIDHTKLDILIVDEIHRKVIGRPWITIAIDVFSRMVTGFYISMDPPGTLGTGLCISASILPKEDLLIKYDVKGEWPSYGIMDTIYLDNAREFRGESLFRSCSEYSINIAWRPVARPEWGGHIERLIGTYVREIHDLPGTTFANTKDRKGYDSSTKAAMTLSELDKWLVTFTVEVYHKRIHSSLGKSPLQKYKDGIFGENGTPGIGIPPKIHDPVRLKLDFLPTLDRTVQDYGVLIDHIHYYHDVLRRWINSTDPGLGKSRVKRKFIFKRDPRDISIIYFLDPDLKEYFPIPYRNITYPSMSLWEYNEILIALKKDNKASIEEQDIFAGYEKLKRIEIEAVDKTKLTKQTNMKAFKREEARRKRTTEKKELENQIFTSFPDVDLTNEKPEPFENIDF